MENRVQQLASNLLNHSVKLKAGEKILIEMFGTDCVDLANELISQSKEIGAIPLFNIIDYKITYIIKQQQPSDCFLLLVEKESDK